MPPPLPDELLDRLVRTFEPARDPQRAAPAAAYMRDLFPFLGIATPARRALTRTVTAGLPPPTEDELRAVALACWSLHEREYQYFACDYLRLHQAVPGPGFLATARTLITTKPWWDTVDPLAAHVVGALLRRLPDLSRELDTWSGGPDVWLIRTAILHQLDHGPATDPDRLFAYCTRQAGHPDFFVRKAIGWALRTYARQAPDAVRAYVANHRSVLSPLSVREATKHL